MSSLHINCDAYRSRSHSNFFASYFPIIVSTWWQHDARPPTYSKSSGVQLVDLQPPAINSAAIALLFLNAATGVFPPDIACEQLLALPVSDVLIEELDQQF